MKAVSCGCVLGLLLAVQVSPVLAQESKSVALAKELVAALQASKLDSIAAKDTSTPDVYFGALYIPGFQLLVVGGAYPQPVLLDTRIAKKEYRDVYIDLNGATPAATRILIEDLGADGLKVRREENQPFDSVQMTGKHTMFDGDWAKQNLSEEDYQKAFATADERYVRMLTALLAQIKKGS